MYLKLRDIQFLCEIIVEQMRSDCKPATAPAYAATFDWFCFR